MKKNIVLVLLLFIYMPSFALHIAGGELYYSYVGPGTAANSDRYMVTLRLFRECNPVVPAGLVAAPMPDQVELGIFTNSPTQLYEQILVNRSQEVVLSLSAPLTCILNPPQVCYQVGYFTFQMDFPKTTDGYTIAFQTCCRSFSIQNIEFFEVANTGTIGEGATYTCTIPGTSLLGPTGTNSSAVFALKDTVLVCQNKKITLDFSATDPDTQNPLYQDSLSYTFCAAYNRGGATSSAEVAPSLPPYQDVVYQPGYTGTTPLGFNVVIDPQTGIISGTIGAAGGYVVNVCVTEWRHGVPISVHRKDFLLRVADCDFPDANLKPSYITCNGYSITLQNESTSAAVNSYYWSFGVSGSTADTSTSPTPTWTYTDTGLYNIKLIVNKGEQCTDSTTAIAGVYPGFFPNFNIIGDCFERPYQFIDATTTVYGYVNGWLWNFGDGDLFGDTSTLQNPSYQYTSVGMRDVSLIVSTSKGCVDTLNKTVNVTARPVINLPFNDTLICDVDTLQLLATTTDTLQFSWAPAYNISNVNTQNPFVYPQTTTDYIVTVNDGRGCINTDTVVVNVTNHAYINLGNDTTICGGDSIVLIPQTNALYFAWTPDSSLSNGMVETPFAAPKTTTQYNVVASISKKCITTDSITIRVVPYPQANAGDDTTLCYGKAIRLNGSITGISFFWSPTNTLANANTLTPLAGPEVTTTYILEAFDTIGCPKPGIDSITVAVLPPVNAFAGDDTTIVFNEPLQLNATGGTSYVWQPSTDLSNPDIANPIALFNGDLDSITYRVQVTSQQGCVGYSYVKVEVFKTAPEIFVPTGFTPNGDGRNDVLRAIAVGIKQFITFQVFNRWGNLVFSSGNTAIGWDGNYAGKPQPSGTYVFYAKAIDYHGNVLEKKGTVVLIR